MHGHKKDSGMGKATFGVQVIDDELDATRYVEARAPFLIDIATEYSLC